MAAKKMFSWLTHRSAGVLLHPTSLPGEQGIGVIGDAARQFIDFLSESGMKYWQTLPLGPTGFGDSPYSSLSSFAGNPFLIDLEPLASNGLMHANDAEPLSGLPRERVNYQQVSRIKWPLLRLVHKRFVEQNRTYIPNYGLFNEFKEENADWLDAFCAFAALKERFNGKFWGQWPEQCRNLTLAKKSKYWDETAYGREFHAFCQYIFFGQWKLLRSYADSRNVEIIGDIPIFVALDSADAWANPELFLMSSKGKPEFVAGVPPDYFSDTGQLWGNPLYNWEVLKKSGYGWWMKRLAANFKLFDIVRLDHFRAFYDYWKIPAGSQDATTGKWVPGPQYDFFKVLKETLPDGRLIAEDLGEIHDGVFKLRDRLGLPGMAILHFAFDGDSDNIYLPHNLVANSVVYPGTHDNDTTRGWYESLSEDLKDLVRRYLRVSGDDISWDLIRWSYQSHSNLAIFQMQDILSCGTQARMNQPGTSLGNWNWRITAEQFPCHPGCSEYLKQLGQLYGRC